VIVSTNRKRNMEYRINKCMIFFLFFLLFISGYAFPQEKIAISSSVDKSRIKIGDIINYRVKVVHDKDIEVKMPGTGANLGGFEIRDYEELKPRKEDDTIISEAEYTISTFTTGDFIIPPVMVQYKEPEDTTYKELATRKIEITVESMKPSEEGDIRDIKAPVELPYIWWETWGKWAVLGLGILLVAVSAFLVYQRKKQGKSIIPRKAPPPRPPHEIALEALDRVKKSDLLKNRKVKQYYTEISEIIRAYFEGRYYIPALERTSAEILEELSKIRIKEEVYEGIKNLLYTSDMVKFAKVIPKSETNQQILETAYSIVERTKVLPINETQNETSQSPDFETNSLVREKVAEKQRKEETEEIQEDIKKVKTEGGE